VRWGLGSGYFIFVNADSECSEGVGLFICICDLPNDRAAAAAAKLQSLRLRLNRSIFTCILCHPDCDGWVVRGACLARMIRR
jgi:hypothetical protein